MVRRWVNPGWLVALGVAIGLLFMDHWSLTHIPPAAQPQPSETPTIAPRFAYALDDVDFGPGVRVTRFLANFELYQGEALDGADGRLYIAYSDRPPEGWGSPGDRPTRLATLDGGRLTDVDLPRNPAFRTEPTAISLVGTKDGMPVVSVTDPDSLYLLTTDGVRRLSNADGVRESARDCVAFDGLTICQEALHQHFGVRIRQRSGASMFLAGSTYLADRWSIRQYRRIDDWETEFGEVRLIGGGPHHILLVEYRDMVGTAEVLEADTPLP